MSEEKNKRIEFIKAFAKDICDSVDGNGDTELVNIVIELKGPPAVGYRLFKRMINMKEIPDSEKVQAVKDFHKMCFERGLFQCTSDAVDIITGT